MRHSLVLIHIMIKFNIIIIILKKLNFYNNHLMIVILAIIKINEIILMKNKFIKIIYNNLNK